MTESGEYVGPEAGRGFIGRLLVILAVIALGILSLVLYPVKLAIAWIRKPPTAKPVSQPVGELPLFRTPAGHM
jgi:hypothetical protein